jgi:hypothetical protein
MKNSYSATFKDMEDSKGQYLPFFEGEVVMSKLLRVSRFGTLTCGGRQG